MATKFPVRTLVNERLAISLEGFIARFWSTSEFLNALLLTKILAKDFRASTWASEEDAAGVRCTRRLGWKHPIPGFAWLTWLPAHTNTEKTETMSYDAATKSLSVQEFSKVDGIPWHDIDVNLSWTVRDEGTGSIHVLVQVQVVFHSGFIQSFAEQQAVGELQTFFAVWMADAHAAISSGVVGDGADTGPLAAIFAAMRGPPAEVVVEEPVAVALPAEPPEDAVCEPLSPVSPGSPPAASTSCGEDVASIVSRGTWDGADETWRSVIAASVSEVVSRASVSAVPPAALSLPSSKTLSSVFSAAGRESTHTPGSADSDGLSSSSSSHSDVTCGPYALSEYALSDYELSSVGATVVTATSTSTCGADGADDIFFLSSMHRFGLTLWRIPTTLVSTIVAAAPT